MGADLSFLLPIDDAKKKGRSCAVLRFLVNLTRHYAQPVSLCI